VLFVSDGPFAEAATNHADGYDVHDPDSRGFEMDFEVLREFEETEGPVFDTTDRSISGGSGELYEDLLKNPREARNVIEETLMGLFDVPGTDLRVTNLPDEHTYRIGKLRERHVGQLVAVRCEVEGAEEVQPLLTEAAIECQRCGTLTYVPQGEWGDIREPHECQGCEHQGPFRANMDHSEMVDWQRIWVVPEEAATENPPEYPIHLKGNLVDSVAKGDTVIVTGLHKVVPLNVQDEVQLDTFMEAYGLSVKQTVDEYGESDIVAMVEDAVDDLDVDDGTSFGVAADDAVARVSEHHDVRRKEIEQVIDNLSEHETDLTLTAGQLAQMG
jgi:replicative DNA helicase Mcm